MGGDNSRKNEGEGGGDGDSARTRIFIGGLGGNVTADDLRKTFSSSVGAVDSVDIVRTEGRSFAYLDFIPSSDKALSKLFSTYNGCLWKGGRLRLEKAKEHYLLRLKREWAEDAELPESTPGNGVDAAKNKESLENPLFKKVLKSEKMQLRLFFPKLKKVKSLPFSGTGKHKYSFQRIEVPSLPTHFCDCEEHSGHSYTTKVEHFRDPETQSGGINEEELKMMKSVMSKLFERKNISKSTCSGAGSSKQEGNCTESIDDLIDNEADEDNLIMNMVASGNNRVALLGSQGHETGSSKQEENSTESIDDLMINESDEDNLIMNMVASGNNRVALLGSQGHETGSSKQEENSTESIDDLMINESDEDNLIMNMVASGNNRVALLGSQGHETSSANEESIYIEMRTSKDRPTQNMLKSQKRKILPSNKKRKSAHAEESDKNESVSATPKRKSEILQDSEIMEPDPRTKRSNTNLSWSQKTAWRDLVGERGKSPFLVSHIMQTTATNEEQPKSDGSSVPDLTESKNQNLEKHGNMEMQKLDESHPAKPNEEMHIMQTTATNEEQPKSDGSSVPDLTESKNQNLEKHGNMDVQKLDESLPAKPNEVVNKSSRGASWLQKSSWTQLVGETNKGSFSISQILPGSVEKQEIPEPNGIYPANSSDGKHCNLIKPARSEFAGDGTRTLGVTNEDVTTAPNSSNMVALAKKQSDTGLNVEQKTPGNNVQTIEENNEVSAPTLGREQHSARKQTSGKDWEISETCPFMKSATSMREWVNTKSALSVSLKKKGNEK